MACNVGRKEKQCAVLNWESQKMAKERRDRERDGVHQVRSFLRKPPVLNQGSLRFFPRIDPLGL